MRLDMTESKTYERPSGPPPSKSGEDYGELLKYCVGTINRLQAPKVFDEHLRKLGKKRKALFGGNKEAKKLAEVFEKQVINSCLDGVPLYANDQAVISQLAQSKCLTRIKEVAAEFGLQDQEFVFYDLCQLCLFKIIFYIDNSGSMKKGNRLQQLHDFLKLFMKINVSPQPLRLKFMNHNNEIHTVLRQKFNIDCDRIETEEQLNTVMANIAINGATPLATNLYTTILEPEVLNRKLGQPLLVVTFTDGSPNGDKYTLGKVIRMAQKKLSENNLPKKAICYQFAQIGDDKEAGEYLDSLDSDATIGDVIDCTSPIEIEMKQIRRKNPELSTEVNYVKKLLLGPIDIAYDSMDEINNRVY
ncbi:hypothetical protein KL910_005160 [Ogataea haglerorum]|nr:hypothetical protein KL947_005064 [Ogataea haglerorum]KAG7783779.1 hypothetical protein KL945_004913 [Ogataea haglerorum]KAG7784547.1 hypothetical protein KL910_005160 [Ogataea haglerorum]